MSQESDTTRLRTALEHHRAGRLREAESLYRQVLQETPDQPDALHLLGMLAYQARKLDMAAGLINKAIEIDPTEPGYYDDLGNVHQARGDPEAARRCFEKVLSLRPDDPDAHYNLGTALQGQGRLDEAIGSYRRALALAPNLAAAHINLGTIFQHRGNLQEAISSYRQAVALDPNVSESHFNLGNALKDQGNADEAVACYETTITLDPSRAAAHNNLGALLQRQGKLAEAIGCYRRALAIDTQYADAYHNLGVALHAEGKLDEAIASLEKALSLQPVRAAAHDDLGNVFVDRGRIDDAIASYWKAISLRANFAGAYNNLGNALNLKGSAADAIRCYRQAVLLDPSYAEAHNNLGNTLCELGQPDAAMSSFQRALDLGDRTEFKANLARCLRQIDVVAADPDLRRIVTRALSEAWGRPADLAHVSIRLIAAEPGLGECIRRAAISWPTRLNAEALYGPAGAAVPANDRLLRSLLESTRISDIATERFLTMARSVLLDNALGADHSDPSQADVLGFYCALARQCFLNDFVFSPTDDELRRASSLVDELAAALRSGDYIPVLRVVAVAAYFPLLSVGDAQALLDRTWPDPVAAVLVQQIAEPLAERRYRADIPALTRIDDGVSQAVREQYEENPYPRWIKVPAGGSMRSVDAYLRLQFPSAPFRSLDKGGDVDILIAGCGTGQESVEMARRFPRARILAVDLSLSSLAYAKRKTVDCGLLNIEYAQADIVKLGTMDRMFDVVTSVGVLHHLADPIAGWRHLLSRLRPGGFMHVGLYSETARRQVVAARSLVAARGYLAQAADIRRCRQELLSTENAGHFRQLTSLGDFYGTNECRDLLFHIREERFSLGQIKSALSELSLDFVGFVLDSRIVRRYAGRFPDDRSKTDLDRWSEFESELPDTFIGMYEFWVQKRAV